MSGSTMARKRRASLGPILVAAASLPVAVWSSGAAVGLDVVAVVPPSTSPSLPADDPEPAPAEEQPDAPAESVPATSGPSPDETVSSVPDSTVVAEDGGDDGVEDGGDDGGGGGGGTTPRLTAPNVRGSNISLGSILVATAVLVAGALAGTLARRRARRRASPGDPRRRDLAAPTERQPAMSPPGPDGPVDAVTLPFLLELGEALIDAGDSVGHVESTLRGIAEANGIEHLGVLVLPSALVLSLERGGSVMTEVRTGRAVALRLDQVDDVLRLVRAADRGEVGVVDGRRRLAEIRASEPPFAPSVVLAGYAVASAGLAMVLRGDWFEVVLAALLGVVIGALRLATSAQAADYQAFWPLVAAAVASTTVFTVARAFDEVAIFPALMSPLIFFLPGALLTIGVQELATGQMVSGASRLAAGVMRLVLLAIGIVAGARLVGVPAGDVRGGTGGWLGEIAPWAGVALFGVGVTWFYGARKGALAWILVVLYVAYAGQVVGGLFFGSALSAFFGALAMTPVAIYASHQAGGPTPLVTFLPGFWLLVPGALGLEGVTRIIGNEGGAYDALLTAGTSMVAISLGVLLALVVTTEDPSRPWSSTRRR